MENWKTDFDRLPLKAYIRKHHRTFDEDKYWSEAVVSYQEMLAVLENKDCSQVPVPPRSELTEVASLYELLLLNADFPKDLIVFFAFLKYVGFFEVYSVNFEDWVNMKNYVNPWSEDSREELTLTELLEVPFGTNWIRVRMSQLPFWSLPGVW